MKQVRTIHVGRSILDDILLILLVVLFFMPVVTQDFLFADDHVLFSESLTGQSKLVDNYYLRDGRPLTGVALVSFVNAFDSFAGFRGLRAISLLSAAGLAIFLRRLLSGSGVHRMSALLVALAIVTSPAMGVYVGWVSCFLYPISAILALYSGLLVQGISDNKAGAARSLAKGLLAVVLLAVSLSIYQITATFFVIPLLLRLLAHTGPGPSSSSGSLSESIIRNVSFGILFAGLSLILYLALVSILKACFLSEGMSLGQRSFIHFPEPITWLIHARALMLNVGPSWFHFLGTPVQAGIACISGGLLVFGCIQYWARKPASPFQLEHRLAWVLTLGILLSPVIILVFLDHSTTPWRLYAGVYAVLFCWLAVVTSKRSPCGGSSRYGRLLSVVFMGYLFCSTAFGSYVFRAGFVYPNAHETALADKLFENHDPVDAELIVLGAPSWFSFEASGTFEYTFRETGLTGLFPRHALRSFYGNYYGREGLHPKQQFVVINNTPPEAISQETCTFTMASIDPEFAVEDTDASDFEESPFFGPVLVLLDYVLYSPEYGYFIEKYDDWFYNPSLGDMKIDAEKQVISLQSQLHGSIMIPKSLDSEWIWSDDLNEWVRLNSLLSDWVWSETSQEWIQLNHSQNESTGAN